MTMDVGSLVSRCYGTPIKPCLQKVLFPLLGIDEPVFEFKH